MADVQEHHFSPILSDRAKQIVSQVLNATGVDLRNAAINIQQFPSSVR